MAANRILVTGGAGYVGSHAADALLRQGYEVIVFDNLSTGHRAAVPEAASFVAGDVTDPADVATVLRDGGISGIMHFAALSLAGESMKRPYDYLRTNTVATINLVEAAVTHGVERFILSSTANLFDRPETLPIDESCPIIPGSPYGESKNFAERILMWAERIHGLRYACLRYFNAAGADPAGARGEHHDPETHLIPLVLQTALGQRPSIEIFGTDYPTTDGTCVRDYVHVSDLAQAHLLALDALADRTAMHYNLGSGSGYSVKQVVETARRITGHEITTVEGPRRAGDPAALVASSDLITKELGWSPRYSDLDTILETAWSWHRGHPDGYPAD